jgi:cell division control protein 7
MFPFFASNDDLEALMEISHIFGKKAMEELAHKLGNLILLNPGRTFHSNLPSIEEPQSLKDIIIKFNPNRKSFPDSGFDLLEKMLALDPDERIRADDALKTHPYFNSSEARV